jgi:hypothetical protein
MLVTLFCIWFLFRLAESERGYVQERTVVYIIREYPQQRSSYKWPEPTPIDPRFDYVLEDDDCAYELMYPSECRER